jgi:hypothetical protein
MQPPYKVMVKACHSVGKTWLSAALVNWFFDSFPESACITTAPTHRDVCDLLWREVRLLRGDRGGFVDAGAFKGSVVPLLYSSQDHYAKGFTAARGESFQGRHQKHMLFIFDEAIGVKPIFWETTKSMFKPDGFHHWLAIGNPTDTSSQMYAEEVRGGWHLVTMSALDHPNLQDALEEREPRFPAAVSIQQWEEWLVEWCDVIPADEADATCIEWPPRSGHFYRPGPEWPSCCLIWRSAVYRVRTQAAARPAGLGSAA